ncbi:MAG: hypothetical protein LBF08_06945 [Dysgonamonadaceae bacterium]|nr:hypothetical protein [Dysgonamonadaceae bacterium]
MKRLQNNIKILALLSALLLLLPYAVKAEHAYRCAVPDVNEQSHHDCSSCAVCCFSFSLFTGNEPLELTAIPQYVEYEIPIFDRQIILSSLFAYRLRGPPFL